MNGSSTSRLWPTKHGTSQACGIKHMVPMSPHAGGPHVWRPTDFGSDSEIEQRTLTSKDFQNLCTVHVWWWILVDTRSSEVLFRFPNRDLSDLYVHLLQYLGQWSCPPRHPALLRCFAQNPPCWRSPHHLGEQRKVWNVLPQPVNRRSS